MDDSDQELGGDRRRGIPRRIGRYRVLDEIGRGGMAVVYRAVLDGPRGFAKEVCLKRVLPGVSDDPSMVEMFVREARLAADLRHANVVQVFDFDVVDDSPFLVMELVDGASLYELFRGVQAAGPPMPIDVACGLGAGILAGLHYVHTRTEGGRPAGLVHRDVSLHNVLVSRDGEVKVADFGIARAIGGGEHTRTGVLKGKIAYIAPEYVAAGHGDHRADLFSAGVVLHELLSGRRRTAPPGSAPGIAWLLHARLPPLREIRPDVPDRLSDLVERLTSSLPGDRPDDAAEALRRLQRAHPAAGPIEIAAFVRRILARPDEVAPAPDATEADSPIPIDETLPTPGPAEPTLTRHDPPAPPIEPTPDPFTAPTDPLPPRAGPVRGSRRRRLLGIVAAVGTAAAVLLGLLCRGGAAGGGAAGGGAAAGGPTAVVARGGDATGGGTFVPVPRSTTDAGSAAASVAAPVDDPRGGSGFGTSPGSAARAGGVVASPSASSSPDAGSYGSVRGGAGEGTASAVEPSGSGAKPGGRAGGGAGEGAASAVETGAAVEPDAGVRGAGAGDVGSDASDAGPRAAPDVGGGGAEAGAGAAGDAGVVERRGMGRLTVRPRPWAMVRIDDGAWEEGPLRGRALPAGRHGVDLEYAPMSCALHRSVVVRRDVEEVVDVDMRAECAASGGAASP